MTAIDKLLALPVDCALAALLEALFPPPAGMEYGVHVGSPARVYVRDAASVLFETSDLAQFRTVVDPPGPLSTRQLALPVRTPADLARALGACEGGLGDANDALRDLCLCGAGVLQNFMGLLLVGEDGGSPCAYTHHPFGHLSTLTSGDIRIGEPPKGFLLTEAVFYFDADDGPYGTEIVVASVRVPITPATHGVHLLVACRELDATISAYRSHRSYRSGG